MTALVILFLLTTQVCHIMASCPEGEEPGFCNSGAYFPQLYCDNVDIEVDKWSCSKKNNVRCVCGARLWRRMDGKCVSKVECDNYKKRDDMEATLETITEAMPFPGDEKYTATVKLLGILDTIELLSISLDSWPEGDCICIKSALTASHVDGAERSVECYKYVTRSGVPDTVKYLLGTQTMMKVVDEIFFQVRYHRGTTIFLKPPVRANVVPHDKDPPFNLDREYEVLEAKETCLVVAFGPKTNGTHHCMVWGILKGKDILESECYDVPSSCTEMYNVWETPKSDPCAAFDVDETRRTKKAQKAEGIIQG